MKAPQLKAFVFLYGAVAWGQIDCKKWLFGPFLGIFAVRGIWHWFGALYSRAQPRKPAPRLGHLV